MTKISERWLITIDLDGTTIGNHDDDPSKVVIPKINIDAINKLKLKGHHVAILTGRPWRLTKDIYEKLNIDTIVVNHNGALIHRPKDSGFKDVKTAMNRKFIQTIIKYVINENISENAIIDFGNESWCLDLNDSKFLNQFHVSEDNGKNSVVKFDKNSKLPMDPYSVAIKFDKNKVDTKKISILLRRKFGNALSCRFWDLDERHTSLEINPLGASKGSALKIIASYYNVKMDKTIAFGDGLNDITMIQNANFGIAMKNAVDTLIEIADDVTDYTNEEGGVGKYLNEFFDLKLN